MSLPDLPANITRRRPSSFPLPWYSGGGLGGGVFRDGFTPSVARIHPQAQIRDDSAQRSGFEVVRAVHGNYDAPGVGCTAIHRVAAALPVKDEADRLRQHARRRGRGWKAAWPWSGGHSDVQWLNEDVLDRQRFAMSSKALKVSRNRFADILDGLVERVAFGMAAGKSGAERVVPAVRLRLQDRGVSHSGKYTVSGVRPIAKFLKHASGVLMRDTGDLRRVRL